MPKPKIFVDVETSAKETVNGIVVEIGWHNLDTGEGGVFIPRHGCEYVLLNGEPGALEVNRYRERIFDAPQDDDNSQLERLHRRLRDATIIAANPRFDVNWLASEFRRKGISPAEPWHYRPICIQALTFQEFGLEDMPSMVEVCRLLEIEPGDHTAGGDVATGVVAYKKLRRMAKNRQDK